MHGHVEYPSRYEEAKRAYIKANRAKTGRRTLLAEIASESIEFRCWLLENAHGEGALDPRVELPELKVLYEAARCDGEEFGDYNSAEAQLLYKRARDAYDAWRKRVGWLPDALQTALNEWGGLSAKQLAWARQAFARNVERAETRVAKEAERRATASHWTAGRQGVVGVIQSARFESYAVHRFASTTSLKALVLLEDGRKLWTTIPRELWPTSTDDDYEKTMAQRARGVRVELTVTVEPSDDDPSMGFGKRPSAGLPVEKPKRERKAREPKPTTGGDETTTRTKCRACRATTCQGGQACADRVQRRKDRRAARKAAQS